MSDYDKRFHTPREQWLRGYFNWIDDDKITDAERHTARDGFDAGCNHSRKQNLAECNRLAQEIVTEIRFTLARDMAPDDVARIISVVLSKFYVQ